MGLFDIFKKKESGNLSRNNNVEINNNVQIFEVESDLELNFNSRNICKNKFWRSCYN